MTSRQKLVIIKKIARVDMFKVYYHACPSADVSQPPIILKEIEPI